MPTTILPLDWREVRHVILQVIHLVCPNLDAMIARRAEVVAPVPMFTFAAAVAQPPNPCGIPPGQEKQGI